MKKSNQNLNYFIALLLLLPLVFACKNNKNKQTELTATIKDSINKMDSFFSAAKPILPADDMLFLPTPKNIIPTNKNVVYCATLLLCWQNIKDTLNTTIPYNALWSNDMKLLNNDTTHQNSLTENDYKSIIEIEDNGSIRSYTSFNKSFNFNTHFKPFNFVYFKDKMVAGFGANKEYNLDNKASILFYKNNDNFILRLNSNQYDHEVILAKGYQADNFSQIETKITADINYGNTVRYDGANDWKYIYGPKDELRIPNISFDFKQGFDSIINQQFATNNNSYTISDAWQRNTLHLNRFGLRVGSEAEIQIKAIAAAEKEIQAPIKLLHFNNPFYILLKRKDSKHAYFIAYIYNTNLMESVEKKVADNGVN